MRTGDEVLDSLLDSGTVQGEDEGASVLLHCAFAPDQPFALAPAFVLCTVENGHARCAGQKGRSPKGCVRISRTNYLTMVLASM